MAFELDDIALEDVAGAVTHAAPHASVEGTNEQLLPLRVKGEAVVEAIKVLLADLTPAEQVEGGLFGDDAKGFDEIKDQ